jgi:hypothetical protein
MDLKININFGLSIILKYYYIFEQLINRNLVNKIFVSIDRDVLNHYRNDSDNNYYQNYIIFLKHINIHSRIIIENSYNKTYQNICVNELSRVCHIPIKFKLYDKLIYKNPIYEYDYVTISTKLLNIDNNLYEKYKNILFNKLNNIGYKVILLGEKRITDCKEYQIHNTYSIYDDLIKNLDNYIDNTIESNNNNNDLESFMTSATILNKSKLNIYMSNGGISILLCYISTNIVGLINTNLVDKALLDKTSYLHDCSNIKISNNFKDFLQNIKVE